VTNSTTEIDTIKLLSGTKCKITSTDLEGIWGSGGVAPMFKLERSYSLMVNYTPHACSIQFQTQTGTG